MSDLGESAYSFEHLSLTSNWLPQPWSSDSKIRIWALGSSSVAAHPPSVTSVVWTRTPDPNRSLLASTLIEFSPQMTLMLSGAIGVLNSKFGGKRGSSLVGSSGNLQDNGSRKGGSFCWTAYKEIWLLSVCFVLLVLNSCAVQQQPAQSQKGFLSAKPKDIFNKQNLQIF